MTNRQLTERPCELFDAYLDGELRSAAKKRFSAHLDRCDACREAIEQQGWIEGLLQAPVVHETASTALRARVEQQFQRQPRQRYVWRIAAAATLPAAVGLWQNAPSPPTASEQQVVVSSRPIVTLVGSRDSIFVPLESSDPNITIVEVYPTLSARQRWRRAALDRSIRQLYQEIRQEKGSKS